MKNTFIKSSDPATIAKLKKLGFSIFSEDGGIVTFINKDGVRLDFAAGDKVVYTNKVSV